MSKSIKIIKLIVPNCRIYRRRDEFFAKLSIDPMPYISGREYRILLRVNNVELEKKGRIFYDKAVKGYAITLPKMLNKYWELLWKLNKPIDITIEIQEG